MRKTSYFITFFAVVLSLILNIASVSRVDWLVVKRPEIFHTKVTVKYGLRERCELDVIDVPGTSTRGKYTDYTCRKFPMRKVDHCEEENSTFCAEWSTSAFTAELALGCAGLSLLSIMFGVSTHSRRRRIWRTVAVLVSLHAAFQIVTFGMVSNSYRTSAYPSFEQARPGFAYVLNLTSWITSVLIVVAVVTTGLCADKGHKWAAGNRAYEPIQD